MEGAREEVDWYRWMDVCEALVSFPCLLSLSPPSFSPMQTKILALATKNRYILGLIHGAVIGVSAVVVIYLLKNRFWK